MHDEEDSNCNDFDDYNEENVPINHKPLTQSYKKKQSDNSSIFF